MASFGVRLKFKRHFGSSRPGRELGKEGLGEAISQSDLPAGRSALRLESTPEQRRRRLGGGDSWAVRPAQSGGTSTSATLQFSHPLQESQEGIRLGLGPLEAVSAL